MNNGFEDYSFDDGYKAVVPVGCDLYHAFEDLETARRRATDFPEDRIPGFWRLKERKA